MANPYILADNRLEDGTPTATDTASGFNVLYLRDLKTFTAWKAASSGTKYITVNCGSSKGANSIAIVKHNLGTAGASVSVESSTNGSTWTERLASFVPSNDKALFKVFTGVSAQYWRIKVVTASVAAQIADLMLGTRIEMPQPPDAPYTPAVLGMEAEVTRSRTGQILGTVVWFKPWQIRARWSNLTRAFVDGTYRVFWEEYASEMKPFFFAWNLDVFPADVRFGTLDPESSFSSPTSKLSSYDAVELNMIGVKE